MPGERSRLVSCPHCGAPTPWNTANPYRPFCSERCKLIDLGQWASEGYRIPQQGDDAELPEQQPDDKA